MNEKQISKNLRREFNKPALMLLIYYGIMNVVVSLVVVLDIAAGVLTSIFSGNGIQSDKLMDQLAYHLQNNGWGYILSTIICGVVLVLWKKKKFCFGQIWEQDKVITPGSFFAILCIFISGQALFQVLAMVLEWFFNLFGVSILYSVESATVNTNSTSMLLYIALFAPVFEEILFRGLVLRSLLPYGRKFAILASAFLFGIFHGNPVQTPYAFAVGLILGYVAVEYCLFWSVILHVINNFVLGEVLNLVTRQLLQWAGNLIFDVLIWGCALGAFVILLAKRNEIRAYFNRGKIHPMCIKNFIKAPAVVVVTVIMSLNILLTILAQFFA